MIFGIVAAQRNSFATSTLHRCELPHPYLLDIEAQFFGRLSCSLVTTLTELARLPEDYSMNNCNWL